MPSPEDPPSADHQLGDQPQESSLLRDPPISRADDHDTGPQSLEHEITAPFNGEESFPWALQFTHEDNNHVSPWGIDSDFYAFGSYQNVAETKEGEPSEIFSDFLLDLHGPTLTQSVTLDTFEPSRHSTTVDALGIQPSSLYSSAYDFGTFPEPGVHGLGCVYEAAPLGCADEAALLGCDYMESPPLATSCSAAPPASHSCKDCGRQFSGQYATANLARHRRNCCIRAPGRKSRPQHPYEKPSNIREKKKRRFRLPFGPKIEDTSKPSDSNAPPSSFEEELRRRGDEADRIASLPLEERDAAQAIEDKRQQGVDIVGPNYYLHVS